MFVRRFFLYLIIILYLISSLRVEVEVAAMVRVEVVRVVYYLELLQSFVEILLLSLLVMVVMVHLVVVMERMEITALLSVSPL